MEKPPVADTLFGAVSIRADDCAVHDMYRFQVKAPAESHTRFDNYKFLATIPTAQAFRLQDEGGSIK